ncbi:MAG: uroporphyrinogen decarboxylase family protein [Bacilli bacterium]|nr:uroporphyrinogen decarboxylase family protein [Bacilli bacterium]
MKWTREQYIDLMTFKSYERPMFCELFGPLVGLDEEWVEQGASLEERNLNAFGFDYVDVMFCEANTGIHGGFEQIVLEDNHEHTIFRDNYGRTSKLCKASATIPLPLDYPVRDMESWLKIKPMFTFNENRINCKQLEAAKARQQQGTLIIAKIPGGFDLPRQLMGEEGACLAYYENPELMNDIVNTAKETSLRVFEAISKTIIIDNLFVHEDMAGKSGPLIGPSMILEFIKPYYRAVWDFWSERGTKLFSLDSDGNMNAVIDAFLECGINILYPCEPAAGMDIVALRKQYQERLAFKGGIDKHVLRRSKEDILRELEYKLQPSMRRGMVFALDHRIPNGTPLDNYRYYVKTAKEILGIPEEDSKWVRMAF